MANIIFNCNTCNDNSPIQLVANDELVPLYYGIQSQKIIGLNNDGSYNDSFIYENGFNNPVWVTVSQNDGKILVGGEFTTYNLTTSNSIVRLNSDGSIDNTFVIGSGFNGTVLAIAIQSDGKILIGGQFNNYNGVGANRIIRLNSDGSVDNTFAYGSGFNEIVYTITIQNDGKILVGGYFQSYNGTGANRIIRLNSNGSIDNTFVYGSGFTLILNPATVSIITIQLDGKILVGGIFSNYNGTNVNNIIRLNQNGSVDNTFIIGSGFDNFVTTIAIQSDGKILVGGGFINYDVTSAYFIIRLNPDGSVDNTFVYGSGFNSAVNIIVIQSDGKILIGGNFFTYNNMASPYIIRLNTDGTFDESFDTKNGLDGLVRSLTIKNDQSLIIGGQFSSYNSRQIRRFIRLNTNGLYDGSLNYINGFSKTVRTISIQSDEKIIVSGEFGTYNFDNFGAILRLHSDGSIDNTFVTGLGFDGTVLTTAIQTDGKILVGGLFTTYSGTSANRIIRLNPDGSIDGSFVYGSGFNGDVIKITIHPNGKILVGGSFDVYQSTMSKSIISLNSDGSIDGSFNIGGGFNDVVTTIDVNTNGDIFVGGNFTDYDGTIANRIIGLRPDGGIFVPFNYGLGFNDNVYTISIQSDGKLLIGGEFTEYDGIPSNRIIRLNSDGSIDNTFITGGGFDFTVQDITIQSDGKILVGGNFQFYDVDNYNRIIRLNTDGSVDTSFTIGDGFDDIVLTVVVQPEGKILVGGDFTSYPLRSGTFQLSEGNCVFIDNYEIVSRNTPNGFFTFGPFISCSECTTPDDSPGTESIICLTCDDPESVTSTSVPHGIYLNEQGRAIAQINTVRIGGFNGLNN